MKPKIWKVIIKPISFGVKPMLRAAAPIKVAATPKKSIERKEEAVIAEMFLIIPDFDAQSKKV